MVAPGREAEKACSIARVGRRCSEVLELPAATRRNANERRSEGSAVNGLSIEKIMETLPHRYPFLLIDRILEYKAHDFIDALKNVSINEPFFQGHFPGHPVMPGVLILESMAQATGMLAFFSGHERGRPNSVYYLAGVDKARFKVPVTAGDQLILHATMLRKLRGIYRFEATASVDGRVVASAEFMTTERSVAE